MKDRQEQISPWSFYDEKIGSNEEKQQKQQRIQMQKKQSKNIFQKNADTNKLSKQCLNLDSVSKSSLILQADSKLYKKYQKQQIVLKVAQLTQIQNSARVSYQSKRCMQKLKTLVLLKMIKRKLHQESDNIIENVLNMQKSCNMQNNHQGTFFPKVHLKSIPNNHQELSPKSKSNQKHINQYQYNNRQLSKNNKQLYELYGESIMQKINNQIDLKLQQESQMPIFSKRFSKISRANGTVIKSYKIINP